MASHSLSRMLCALALVGGFARAETPAPATPLIQRLYPVADLIAPLPVAATCCATPIAPPPVAPTQCCPKPIHEHGVPATMAAPRRCDAGPTADIRHQEQLMKLVRLTVAPQSWADAGGTGMMEFAPDRTALVVFQTADVHEMVGELLTALRKLQAVAVGLDVHVVQVSDSWYQQWIADECGLRHKSTTLLEGHVKEKLFELMKGDRRATIMSAPKLMTYDRQDASIRVGNEQFFLTDPKMVRVIDQNVCVPINRVVSTGFLMTVRPTATPDRRRVILKINAEHSELADPKVPQFPVTSMVTPVFEGGAMGHPVPSTQFIQQPVISVHVIEHVADIPDGKTALLYGGRATHNTTHVDKMPVLCELPVVGDLFRTETRGQEHQHMLVFVTPRIVIEKGNSTVAAKEVCLVQCHDELVALAPCAAMRAHPCPVAMAMPAPACQVCCPMSAMPCLPTVTAAAQACQGGCSTCAMPALPCHPLAIQWQFNPAALAGLGEEQATRPATPAQPSKTKLDRLMARYYEACEDGRTSAAKKLALRCLELDATCFDRDR